ncbi:hypothetical protein Q4506_09470 [Colwellia sp. 4_MG-2023]|jgi:hypothetical protein|uniref:hypothetical protein n=1 Tax=unclassified Colwellia TaxID=196834 RepID=UPI001C0A396E|nr:MULTISPECIES: hypothetical protein [unclassified Colwellia]MBU2924692.1 hypothetical protein [Colwellia sp. C2M11]MDO6488416.1 hypothetical protein [Colwellia sp. 6_MG-2023]MDO6507041.1 hypothetical protein [Colwellia sp. 5_MG-2023]MDO6555913.1 hypothetical protein [Colwellia sp. 4_MG-2023]MDO6653528.1 hypothetical protein [Colwellia sp. 3_MG-2023]
MENWLAILIIGVTIALLIGNFSTFYKSTNHKMRKKALNDREETLPRTNKSEHKMPTIKQDQFKK